MKIRVDSKSSKLFLTSDSKKIKLELEYCIVNKNNTDGVVFNPDHIEAFIRLYLECPTTLNIDHFILEGMSKDFGGRPFVTEVGIKHLFSCIVGFYSHQAEIKATTFFLFTNTFLRTDLNKTILEELGLSSKKAFCKFCSDLEISNETNTTIIEKLIQQAEKCKAFLVRAVRT